MAAPWTGEEAKGEREGEPVGGEEVGLGWLDERAWALWFDEAVDNDNGNNCK